MHSRLTLFDRSVFIFPFNLILFTSGCLYQSLAGCLETFCDILFLIILLSCNNNIINDHKKLYYFFTGFQEVILKNFDKYEFLERFVLKIK